jgi:subtilisin family serine protease
MQRAHNIARLALLVAALLPAALGASAVAAPPPHPESNPLFAAQWWLRGSATIPDRNGALRASNGVDAIRAWPETTGEGVVVAVVDSGVDPATPALAGRLLPGRDFVTGKPLVRDRVGHGTHVATLIVGNPQDGNGIFGVAPAARVLPLGVGTADGRVVDKAAAAALAHAIRNPQVRVINLSWGRPSTPIVDRALKAVAAKRSVLLVTAAGNGSDDLVRSDLLPQSFDDDAELTVASTNMFNGLSSFSNYGTHVEVAAPGEHILSSFPGGTLKVMDGTSAAAPIVSGIAALLFSRYPAATAAQVKRAIVSSCSPVPQLTGAVGCGGIASAPAALEALGTIVAAATAAAR